MEIKVAKTAGFCYGVERGVNMVRGLIETCPGPIRTLGPIIHNPQMIEELSGKGVTVIDAPEEASPGDTVVIRSHGVPRQVRERAEAAGVCLVDATCPFVSRIHGIARRAGEQGRVLLLAGDEGHPEIQGIVSWCPEHYVFANLRELQALTRCLPSLAGRPVTLAAQTTMSRDTYGLCRKYVEKVYTNAIIFDTICYATYERQKEAEELASVCDIMVVVGGRESANTRRLYELCGGRCPATLLVESADELPGKAFFSGAKVGVTAGASTPASVIKEVVNRMSNEERDVVLNDAEQEQTVQAAPSEETASPEAVAENDSAQTEEMDFAQELEKSFKTLNTGDRVTGIVAAVYPNEIQMDLGTKQAGYVPFSEFTSDPSDKLEELVKPGDELDLFVVRVNDVEGTIMLSKRKIDAMKGWDAIEKAVDDKTIFEGTVLEAVKGGLIAVTNGVKVFIPMSHVSLNRNVNLEEYVKTSVRFRILETDRRRKRAIASIRTVVREERKSLEEKFWATAEVGARYTGMVKSLTSYGAFVDLGGIDGMVHITELSWNRVKHPSDVVKVGDMVEVYIKELDPEKKRISLGYRSESDNPWNQFTSTHKVGDVVNVKVVKMMPFGAFAEVIPGVDGLIHISQIADHRIAKPQDVLSVDEQVDVKITDIDYENQKISLSIRALLEPQTDAE